MGRTRKHVTIWIYTTRVFDKLICSIKNRWFTLQVCQNSIVTIGENKNRRGYKADNILQLAPLDSYFRTGHKNWYLHHQLYLSLSFHLPIWAWSDVHLSQWQLILLRSLGVGWSPAELKLGDHCYSCKTNLDVYLFQPDIWPTTATGAVVPIKSLLCCK